MLLFLLGTCVTASNDYPWRTQHVPKVHFFMDCWFDQLSLEIEKDYSFHYCVFLQFKNHMFNYLKSCDLTQRWYKIFFMSAFIRKADNQLLTLWMLGNFTWFFVKKIYMIFCRLLIFYIFFQNQLFRKILIGIPSENQTIWIQNILSGLIWIQTFAKVIWWNKQVSIIMCWTWKYPLFLPFRTLMSSAFSSAYALWLPLLPFGTVWL